MPVPGCEDPAANLQPDDGMNDTPIDHTHNIANPVVLVPTQHRVHEADCDSLTLHRHNNQRLATRVAVRAHSAAELVAIGYHRQ